MPLRKETTLISSEQTISFFKQGTDHIPFVDLLKIFGPGPVDIHIDGDIKGTLTLIPYAKAPECGYKCQIYLTFIEREWSE